CPSRRRKPRLRRPSLRLRPPSPPRRRESPPPRRLPRRRSRLRGTLPRSRYRSRQAVAIRTPALHRPRAWRRFRPTESRTRRFPAAAIRAYMRLVVAMLILLLPVPAMAQPPAAPPSQQAPPRLEPVVVEGVRVPADRTRTDPEASEELSRVPGGTAVVDQTTIEQTR